MGALLGLAGLPGLADTPPATDSGRADLLMVVDCLLPGQVRTLGQRTTYLSARRPARLTARDCQIRGGEYVAYDRADSRSALGAWLPQAEQGDPEARVIVGEIYERGIGVEPDYAAAARWYRLAADDGSKRAQINLGHLYEQGLGVEADPKAAFDWYRRAAGRDAAIELDTSPDAAESAEAARLAERARELEASLAQLRGELGSSREALSSMENRATEAEAKAAAAESAAVRAQAAAQAAADAAATQVADLPAPAPDRSAEIEALQRELASRMSDAESLSRALDAARAENAERLATLAQATQETEAARSAAAAERKRLEEATARLTAQESELAAQRAAAERLGRELAAATTLATERKAEVDRLAQPLVAKLMAGPELVILEPTLTVTRDIVPVATAVAGDRRVVGRVTAPAGLVSVTVNDVAVSPNEYGVFTTTLPAQEGDAPVLVAAIDRQGKRGEARFTLRAATAAPVPVAQPREAATRTLVSRAEFGNYHALVIGNNDYRTLPDLSSP